MMGELKMSCGSQTSCVAFCEALSKWYVDLSPVIKSVPLGDLKLM